MGLSKTKVEGTLYIVSAPSGAGKSSLISAILKNDLMNTIKLSISYTTRNMRPNEQNGIHYYFINRKSFEDLIIQNEFLEHVELFGNYYGTSRNWMLENVNNGSDVILDIDWQGARQIRKEIPFSKSVFILPTSYCQLEYRLNSRAQDSKSDIARRVAEAESEISHYNEYDYIILNDDFDTALVDFQAIIRSERLKKDKQIYKYHDLIQGLLEK
ncbi:guanylate kinase [Candidatus Photodesmus katoptron]|uniref:Guanylate kinase n=1 Tax=Candidatus Photodesmus katoptron Akat1 TaxID=1236703 RepID=S3DJ78_9GAMM|nr:guanylate kinase [Candidatus Photodesmus katoptron]EPE37199.1 guanylate kinase [Candidatus Photodesmus katoptron Akat1]KEY90146.1 guanylate kinase [Candidatus Photodesmus katoptron]